MAFPLDQQQDEEDKKQSNVLQPTGSGTAGGGVLTAGATSGNSGQKGPASTGFVNFQSYLDANKGTVSQNQDTLVNKVRESRDQAVGDLRSFGQERSSALQEAGKDTFGMKKDDPLSNPWQDEAAQKHSAVQNTRFEGDAWDRATNAWRGVQSDTAKLSDRENRSELLERYLGRPGYTSGQKALDSALLGSDTTKYDQFANETREMGDVAGKERQGFDASREALLQQWNPKQFEERPDFGEFGYSDEVLNTLTQGLAENKPLTAMGHQGVNAIDQAFQDYLAGEDLGAKQRDYAQRTYDQFRPQADEYDYRFDLQGGKDLSSGFGDYMSKVNAGIGLDQAAYGDADQMLKSFQEYLGREDINERSRPELDRLEKNFRDTLAKNDRNLINAGLRSAGYSEDGYNSAIQSNQADQVISPENRVSMQEQLNKLREAVGKAWDPEVKAELQGKAQALEGALIDANYRADYHGTFGNIAQRFNLDPVQLQDNVRAIEQMSADQLQQAIAAERSPLHQGYAPAHMVYDAVSMMINNGIYPSNPQAKQRLLNLATKLGVYGSSGSYVPPSKTITVQSDPSVPVSGGVGR